MAGLKGFVRGGEVRDAGPLPAWRSSGRLQRVVAVTSNKGGVGKSTIAANLAVHLRALHPELPVLLLGFDDQTFLNTMLGEGERRGPTILDVMRGARLRDAIRPGRYGVHYVASDRTVSALKHELRSPGRLAEVITGSDFAGLVLVDTKSDLEILTQNALFASDLAVVVVSDRSSLLEAERVYDLLEAWGRPRERARTLLSLVDRRVKFVEGDHRDVLGLLVAEIRERGHPLFQTFLSRSPKIESLQTNPGGRSLPILHGASDSLVNRQMGQLAADLLAVLAQLEGRPLAGRGAPPEVRQRPARSLPTRELPVASVPRRRAGAALSAVAVAVIVLFYSVGMLGGASQAPAPVSPATPAAPVPSPVELSEPARALVSAVLAHDPTTASAGARSLHPEDAAEALLVAFDAGDGEAAALAVGLLDEVAPARARRVLVGRLLGPPAAEDPTARRARAAWALGILGDESVVEPLMQAFTSREREVRIAAARSIQRIRSRGGADGSAP